MAVTLKSRIPQIERSLQLQVGRDLKQAAENIRDGAEERVDLGPIAPHIKEDIEVKGGGARYSVNVPEFYAKFVEFGRANAPAYPFLVPAAEEERPALEARVQATLSGL